MLLEVLAVLPLTMLFLAFRQKGPYVKVEGLAICCSGFSVSATSSRGKFLLLVISQDEAEDELLAHGT